MSKTVHISSSVIIREGTARMNRKSVLEKIGSEAGAFAKELYKVLKCDYPKFYKMDNLCKLAFVATELLLKGKDLSRYDHDDIALVFSNASSSLDTDRAYFKSVENKENYFPSPAVFVYTLPNIMMGELCIRHKIHGENVFFVSEKFDAELLAGYSQNLFDSGKAAVVICVWIEISTTGWDAALFLLEEGDGDSLLSAANLEARWSSVNH